MGEATDLGYLVGVARDDRLVSRTRFPESQVSDLNDGLLAAIRGECFCDVLGCDHRANSPNRFFALPGRAKGMPGVLHAQEHRPATGSVGDQRNSRKMISEVRD